MRVVDKIDHVCRVKNYSPNTAKVYRKWAQEYMRFCRLPDGTWRHPDTLGVDEVTAFISHLATRRNVAASTQNQALQALLFLYRQVLGIEIDDVQAVRAKRPKYIPAVLSASECLAVLQQLDGTNRLAAELMYGGGLRVSEVFALRVKDIDIARRRLHIRQSKGAKDRLTMLPHTLVSRLQRQLEYVTELHRQDTAAGVARVELPAAFERKSPGAASQLAWYWLLPSAVLSKCPRTQRVGRHHLQPSTVQRAVPIAAIRAGIHKRVTCHTMRHSFATHLIESGVSINQLKDLLGHSDIRTTEIYLHCQQDPATVVLSPLDRLSA